MATTIKVKVAIASDFLSAFAKIPRKKQNKVMEFIDKFRENPTSSGINYEKINAAKDRNLRSVRIDNTYRAIVLSPELGNVYLLLWVDHHDDAYAWASKRVCNIHPETGSLQVIDVETTAAVPEKKVIPTQKKPTGLFSKIRADHTDTVSIPGGPALVGTDIEIIPHDGEGPMRKVNLQPFKMDATSVTNARFARFIDETGFVTEAERFGWSFAFFSHLGEEIGPTQGVLEANWWRKVHGAYWRLINGPGSEDHWHSDRPVVHVSWNDAKAFAVWAGGRLPTEAEWEHAARGGLGDVRFPWGNQEPDDDHFFPCNIWQGDFPTRNSGADGFQAIAPARSYEPNEFGLYNMVGNNWDWTEDTYRIRSLKKAARERQRAMKGYKTTKGGSYLCHISYCYRYRIAARTATSPDSTTSHQGFRLVYDP